MMKMKMIVTIKSIVILFKQPFNNNPSQFNRCEVFLFLKQKTAPTDFSIGAYLI